MDINADHLVRLFFTQANLTKIRVSNQLNSAALYQPQGFRARRKCDTFGARFYRYSAVLLQFAALLISDDTAFSRYCFHVSFAGANTPWL